MELQLIAQELEEGVLESKAPESGEEAMLGYSSAIRRSEVEHLRIWVQISANGLSPSKC